MSDCSSRVVDVNGTKLHLKEQGSGPAVLLLHGLGSSAADWSKLAPLLPGYRLLMPDMRGHGQSEKPPGEYGVPLFAKDVAALIDALGLGRVHVVGISMGGMIGFQLAVDRPDLVASLTAINSGPELVARDLKTRLALGLRLLVLRLLGPKALAGALAKALFPEPHQAAMRDEVRERIGANDPDAYLRATKGLIGWSVQARLSELRCPVLVVASEHDDYTPVELKRAYTKLLPDARLEVLAGSRHFASFDAPEPLARLVNGFLKVPLMVELGRLAVSRGDRKAITCGEDSVTFGELERRTNRLARSFIARGVKPGAFVTIALPNGIAFYEAVIAAWKCGATPQPMSARMPGPEREAVLELVKPALVVSSNDAPPDASLSDAALPPVISESFKAPLSGGSTGRPKLIVSTQPAVTDSLLGLAPHIRVPRDGVHLVTGPLHHNGPLLMSLCALVQGNHLVVMPRFDAASALELIARHKVDWMYAVPTMMQRISRLPAEVRAAHDVSSLRTVLHLAAPCPAFLKQQWIEWLGADRVWELYAATEVQAITVIGGDAWLAHRGSVGKPVVGELQILDLEGRPVPAGTIGEVWMRRSATVGGPYRYVGATPRTREGSWESVGDMGHVDAEGYLYLADRQTDMILVGGSNVYPAEIEAALEAHPAVASACVVGLPDEDLGNVPHAIVQLSDRSVADAALVEHCRSRLSSYKVPKTIERVEQPLRDEAGKVRRSALRAERLVAR